MDFSYRKYIGLCSLIALWQGKIYDLSKKQKQMFMYLTLRTSAQALTVSIFTDSYRGEVKYHKNHVQSIYANLIIKQANTNLHFC